MVITDREIQKDLQEQDKDQEKVETVEETETRQEEVETGMKTTSARDDKRARDDEHAREDERARDDARVSVETWGDPGADGLAGSQPQGHQMRGGGKDRPQRVKKPVNKFVETGQKR